MYVFGYNLYRMDTGNLINEFSNKMEAHRTAKTFAAEHDVTVHVQQVTNEGINTADYFPDGTIKKNCYADTGGNYRSQKSEG